MPMLRDAPVIVSTNSILIGAKAAAHPDIGDLFHVPEIVTAATGCAMTAPAKGP